MRLSILCPLLIVGFYFAGGEIAKAEPGDVAGFDNRSSAQEHNGKEDDWLNESDGDWQPDTLIADSVAEDSQSSPLSSRQWSLDIDGVLRSGEDLWVERFDSNPVAKARQSVDGTLRFRHGDMLMVASAHVAYDLAYLYQRDTYDEATLDSYEFLGRLRDLYIAFDWGGWEASFGYQTFAWGEGDVLSHLDIVSPKDMREVGLVELEDLRLAVLSSRLGYYWGEHSFELVWTHLPSYGLLPPPLGEFNPLRAYISEPNPLSIDLSELLANKTVRFQHGSAESVWERQQFFLRWLYRGSGLDAGFYAAWLLDPAGVVSEIDVGAALDMNQVNLSVPLEHQPFALVGASLATSLGSFLLKGEIAAELGRPLMIETSPGEAMASPLAVNSERSDVLRTMASVSYSGVADTLLACDISQSVRIEGEGDLVFELDYPAIALRVNQEYFQGDLSFDVGATGLGLALQQGWIFLGQVTYSLTDGLTSTLGFVSYHAGTERSQLAGLTSHDRVFVKFRWRFSVLEL